MGAAPTPIAPPGLRLPACPTRPALTLRGGCSAAACQLRRRRRRLPPPSTHVAAVRRSTEAALALLERLKDAFLERMAKVKSELSTLINEVRVWEQRGEAGATWVLGRGCWAAAGAQHWRPTRQHPRALPPPNPAPQTEDSLRDESERTLQVAQKAEITAALVGKLGDRAAEQGQQQLFSEEAGGEEAGGDGEASWDDEGDATARTVRAAAAQ